MIICKITAFWIKWQAFGDMVISCLENVDYIPWTFYCTWLSAVYNQILQYILIRIWVIFDYHGAIRIKV